MTENILPQTYDAFEPLVADIRAGTSEAVFLGSGSESAVWRLSLEGTDYAVKLAHEQSLRGRPRDTRRAVEGSIIAGLRGLGIPGLEQIQTGSPEHGVVIYTYVSDTPVSQLTESDKQRITPEHARSLWNTVVAATNANIQFDGWNNEGGNAFFSPSQGFTLIDYWADRRVDLAHNMRAVVRSLGSVGISLRA